MDRILNQTSWAIRCNTAVISLDRLKNTLKTLS